MKQILFFLLILSLQQCVKKEADGKEYCEKNCKSACEMVNVNVSSCIDDCYSSCVNVGPNPFYKGN